jgi:hypothetical protein
MAVAVLSVGAPVQLTAVAHPHTAVAAAMNRPGSTHWDNGTNWNHASHVTNGTHWDD